MPRRSTPIIAVLLAAGVTGGLLVAPAHGAAGRAPRLAILPLDAVNLADGEPRRYQQKVRGSIGRRHRFTIVSAADVARAMEGRTAECFRQVPCMRQLGQQLAAATLLALRVGRLGETTVVQMTAFDVQRGARVGTWEEVLRPGGPAAVDLALGRMIDRFAPLPRAAARPWYRRWWIWTAVGVAVATAVTTTALVTTRSSGPGPDTIIVPP